MIGRTSLTVVTVAQALLALSTTAHAALSEGCNALGLAMVEHSCFHSTFGPFVSVAGTPGVSAQSATPNVDPVHTEYRVGLSRPGEAHVVTYSPERSGSWAVFTGSDLPLEVLDEDSKSLPQVFEQHEDTGCEALPIARVFSLTAKERYTLRLGPTQATSVVLVIEYADDFLVAVGRDQDNDGYGSTEDSFISNCVPPPGYAANTADCDDSNPAVNPAATERCDDVDDNCNGSPDDEGLQCRTGVGACEAIGQLTCIDDTAACDVVALAPQDESCNGKDDDCDGTIDNGDDALCDDSARPRCVRRDFTAFCGCLLDVDCGSIDSGRVCDTESTTCEDGCSTLPSSNGCPDGKHCETEGGLTRGVCILDEKEMPHLDEQVQHRSVTPDDGEQGCQCATHPRTTQPWKAASLSSMLALAWLRRRRKDKNRKPTRPEGIS